MGELYAVISAIYREVLLPFIIATAYYIVGPEKRTSR